MVAKKAVYPSELPKPKLTVSRSDATSKIQKQIDLGQAHEEAVIGSAADLDHASGEKRSWHDYNKELLGTIFDNIKISKEYESSSHGAIFSMGNRGFYEKVDDYRESVRYKLKALQSILRRIELFEEPHKDANLPAVIETPVIGSDKNVFIVHGHDEELKEKTARLVSDLGLSPIILHEQVNSGLTLIEKLEINAERSTFAIILLTPDDTGYSVADGQKKAEKRARQNVILELGYFIGKFGRSRTSAVYKGLKAPSDFDGIVYISYDDEGAWRYKIAKELKAAGYDINMNNL